MSLADRMNGVKGRPGWRYGLGITHADGTVDYRLYYENDANRVIEFTWDSRGQQTKLDAACEVIDRFMDSNEGGGSLEGDDASLGWLRGLYVTGQVQLWISNDGDCIVELARATARALGVDAMATLLSGLMRGAAAYSAPWQVAQELAPNDYDRIDWRSIADGLLEGDQ